MLDTGICAQESLDTLLFQQGQLVVGNRYVQMFPTGTFEIPLPLGFKRYVNKRGVFHYNPEKITSELLNEKSLYGRENEFLGLGPYSKSDVALRVLGGEEVICITEYKDGVELRSAAGSVSTIGEQYAYFSSTKEPDSTIVLGAPPERCLKEGK